MNLITDKPGLVNLVPDPKAAPTPAPTPAPTTTPTAGRITTPAATTQQTTTSPGQDTDLQALLNGNMVPMLQQMLGYAVQEYMKPPPKREDYADEDSYLSDLFTYQDGAGDRLDAVTKLATQLNQARKLGTGTIELNDGTLITQDMLNSSDPAVAAQARAAFDNRSREVFNSYNQLMNEAGLNQFTVDLQATNAENDRRTKEFNANLDRFDSTRQWDATNIDRAAQEVSRQISGLQESRARADLKTEALLKAAPWATEAGKTDFTGNDFGSAIAGMVRQGGGNPAQSLIRFPTSVTVDPGSEMAANDAALGVTGPLPTIPGMTLSPADMPAAPTLVAPPAPPTFGTPTAPVSASDVMKAQQMLVNLGSVLGGRLRGLVR